MANRRMFSNRIIGSARFIKMPPSIQALYFHLCLNADDDGVVEAYPIMRMLGSTEDDVRILNAKNLVTVLNEDLVSHITDWLEHNSLRADRKINSVYQNLLLQMVPEAEIIEPKPRSDVEDNSKRLNGPSTDGIGKDRIGKDSKLSAKPKTLSNFRDQRRIENGKPPMQKKSLTGKAKEVWKELTEVDYEFKMYRERAEEKTGEDYSLLDDGVNPQTRRLMGLTISKVRAKGKTMDDYYEYVFERNEYARKNKYNPLVCLTDRMMMDWQLEGIKVKDTIEDVARRLLEAARKRGNGDTDESDYRMWARTGMAKELGLTDNDFFDSEEYKKVKHIIGD